jgi:hypothetical protein
MTIWRMRMARWILNHTNTHSEYVILITFRLIFCGNARSSKAVAHVYISGLLLTYWEGLFLEPLQDWGTGFGTKKSFKFR